jgi:acetyl-CoA carboxylase carboxyltransferase component
MAHDFGVARGATSAFDARRMADLLRLAASRGAPAFLLCDSEGGRIAEGPATIADNAELLRTFAECAGRIPLFAGIFGVAGGAAAYAASLCDFVVAIADRSFAFLSGPAVVETALGEAATLESLGHSDLHSRTTGLYSALAADDLGVVGALRRIATYLPPSAASLPPEAPAPTAPCPPCPALPPGNRPFDVRPLIAALVDPDSFTELHAPFGEAIIGGLARLDGRPCILLASQPLVAAGAIDTTAAQKIARLVRLGASFGLPIITLADTPGFLPGRQQESARILVHGARVISAWTEARQHVPTLAVILRRAVGGGVVLAASAETVLAFEASEIVQMGDKARDAIENQATAPTSAFSAVVQRRIAPGDLRTEVLHALRVARPVVPTPPGGRRVVPMPI